MIRRRATWAALVVVIALATGGCEFLPTVTGGGHRHGGNPDRVRCLLPEGCEGADHGGGR